MFTLHDNELNPSNIRSTQLASREEVIIAKPAVGVLGPQRQYQDHHHKSLHRRGVRGYGQRILR